MASKPILEKAARLAFDGQAMEISGARAFVVDGDHGRYTVCILPRDAAFGTGLQPRRHTCSCDWFKRAPEGAEHCSHVLAVLALLRIEASQSGDPFAPFDGD